VVEYYESWVEPNNPPAGAANPQQYATLLKAQYAEIQSLNSQYGLHIKLLLGSPIGFGNSADSKPLVFPWIDQVLTDLDGQRAFDGAALHAYRLGSQVYGPNDPAPDYVGSLTYPDYGCRLPSDGVCEMTWSQELSAYEQEFINHGYGTTPLWLTEFGWPGEANPGNSPYDLDEAQQNTDLQEAYADLLKLPFVQGAFWFNLRNYQPGYATTDPEYFFYMGLLEYDYTKKPAATSFSALAAANPDR
jgi:hypothetical protein